MIEVFIAYGKSSNIKLLGWTLEAWNLEEFDPVALEVKNPSDDRIVRVAAEAIAKGDYIIAKLGSEPEKPEGWAKYQKGKGIRVEACQPRVQ